MHDGRFAAPRLAAGTAAPLHQADLGQRAARRPQTAARLALATGNRVRVEAEGHALEAPVWISERQAEQR
ncbi:MAG: hypothetical protein U1F25_08930 [Rubrivivax sp.]